MTKPYANPETLSFRIAPPMLAAWSVCANRRGETVSAWINGTLAAATNTPPPNVDTRGEIVGGKRDNTKGFRATVDAGSLAHALAANDAWWPASPKLGQSCLVRLLCSARAEAEAERVNPTWCEAKADPVHFTRTVVVPQGWVASPSLRGANDLANRADGWLKITGRALDAGILTAREAREELATALRRLDMELRLQTGETITFATAVPLPWLARAIAPRLPVADLVRGAPAAVVCEMLKRGSFR